VARIAERGGEVLTALRATAPGLTLQQLYKLTEHHHDDWAVGAPPLQSPTTYPPFDLETQLSHGAAVAQAQRAPPRRAGGGGLV